MSDGLRSIWVSLHQEPVRKNRGLVDCDQSSEGGLKGR
jgi:hypothetical protein